MLLPPSFHQLYEGYQGQQVRIMKGILSEINCVYLYIDKTLFLWKYMDAIGNIEEITLQNIYNPENENNARVFSFGPYEEEIRAVNVCRPSSHVFVQADIKMVFIIAFASSVKLYNFLCDEKTIALESLEVKVNIQPKSEITMVILIIYFIYMLLYFFILFCIFLIFFL